MNKYWYKNAVIYSLDVETFKDSNGDGTGDLQGLKNGLSYLSSLGVTCLWLLPIFDTPNRDNGYDVRDYYQVDPRLGNLGHFAQMVDAAEEVGMRVIIDLPVNHTSVEHQWFQESRKSKDSKYRDYYIWEEEPPKSEGRSVVAGEGEESSNWKFDEEAGAYYFHTFFPHQPDLNISNPKVQEEIFRIMHLWLKLGVSGFRVDAASKMFQGKGDAEFQGDPHELFRNIREFIGTIKADAVLLAEANLEPERYQDFFGDEDEMHMLFHFYVNNYLFLSLAREKAVPLADALKRMPRNSKKEQFAIFLRNHDELNLDKLKDDELQEVFQAFAPDEKMQIFGRGIRRRLAPILGGNHKKLEMVHSLLFTLPGTPVIRYGQEIGMGDDLSMEGRSSVRTTMQWSDRENGGFSNAPADQLIRNAISKGEYGYEKVNVNDQHRNPDSLLNLISRMIDYRKEFPEFGWGDYKILDVKNPEVLAHLRESDKGMALAVHNFSNKEITISLDLEDPKDIVDVFGDEEYESFDPDQQKIRMNPYGYRWLHKRKLYL